MAFVPAQDKLRQVLDLFRNLQVADNQRHKAIFEQLTVFKTHPEFNSYLAFILSSAKDEHPDVRSQAGIELKNNIMDGYERMTPQAQAFVKAQVFATIGDPSKSLRSIVAVIVTSMAWKESLQGWGPHLLHLVSLLDRPEAAVVEGSFNALSKICEDMAAMLDSEDLGRPLNVMIPKFISFFLHSDLTLRRYAVESVNCFLGTSPQALLLNMPAYLDGLCKLTQDPSPDVRKLVCAGFVGLVVQHYGFVAKIMPNVMRFILQVCQDKEESVALEACEFWAAFCHCEHADKKLLREALPHLLPILLNGMRYSEEEVAQIEADSSDDKPDEASAIRPRIHKSRGLGDEDDEEEDGEVTQWNLRKCAASSLDTLAGLFKNDLWALFQPMLQERLGSKEWAVRESGLLALGAVAEGCYEAIEPFLPTLVPYLISLLKDLPLVRSISAWTLSRYAAWILAFPDDKYMQAVVAGLFECMLTHNKRVQEASCSAFATLEDEAQERLVPYLGAILRTVLAALQRYQAKNLLILYDAIGTLAEGVGSALDQPAILNALMPPLLAKWQEMKEDDRSVFALGECFSALAHAVGASFVPFAGVVVNRCLATIARVLLRFQQAVGSGEGEYFTDKDFVEASLDLLTGVTESIQQQMERFVGPSNALLLLYQCLQDESGGVRQSAFALLGSLAHHCPGQVRGHMDKYVAQAAINLDPGFPAVCNNASWAVGEMCTAGPNEVKPFVSNVLHYLLPVLLVPNLHNSLLENLAITLGRVVLLSPQEVLPHFPNFAKAWVYRVSQIRDAGQKERTWAAVLALLRLRPDAALPCFQHLAVLFLNWQRPSEALYQDFAQVVAGVKQMAGANWEKVCHPEHLKALQARFPTLPTLSPLSR